MKNGTIWSLGAPASWVTIEFSRSIELFISLITLYGLIGTSSEFKWKAHSLSHWFFKSAIFEGKNPERSSKFYKFDAYKNKSVDKISQEILNLLENQNLSESEKGEVVLKVLRKIMNFKGSKGEKLAWLKK